MVPASPDFTLVIPYGERRIRCRVRRSRSRPERSIAIHVEADGKVLVDAPLQAPESAVRSALIKRAKWIDKQLVAVEARLRFVTPREYVSGATVYYLGRRYRLKVLTAIGRPATRLAGGYVEVSVPDRNPEFVHRALSHWLRERARIVLTRRLEDIASTLRWTAQTPPTTFRRMKAQWGSCSPNGRLTLNPGLVCAPRECIDYVLLHELCHLKEHNHSAKFYRLLDLHMPEWRRAKVRLDDMVEMILAS